MESGEILVNIMENESLPQANDIGNMIAALDKKLLTVRKQGLISLACLYIKTIINRFAQRASGHKSSKNFNNKTNAV
jgi:hypothetical protein